MFGLRTKLLVFLGSLLLILITVTLLANSVLSNYSNRIQKLFENDFESAVACQNMKEAIENIDLQVQKRVWGDLSADLQSVKAYEVQFEAALARQTRIAELPGESAATQKLNEKWQEYRANLPYVFAIDRTSPERQDTYRYTIAHDSREVRDAAQGVIDMNMASMRSGHGAAADQQAQPPD